MIWDQALARVFMSPAKKKKKEKKMEMKPENRKQHWELSY